MLFLRIVGLGGCGAYVLLNVYLHMMTWSGSLDILDVRHSKFLTLTLTLTLILCAPKSYLVLSHAFDPLLSNLKWVTAISLFRDNREQMIAAERAQ